MESDKSHSPRMLVSSSPAAGPVQTNSPRQPLTCVAWQCNPDVHSHAYTLTLIGESHLICFSHVCICDHPTLHTPSCPWDQSLDCDPFLHHSFSHICAQIWLGKIYSVIPMSCDLDLWTCGSLVTFQKVMDRNSCHFLLLVVFARADGSCKPTITVSHPPPPVQIVPLHN